MLERPLRISITVTEEERKLFQHAAHLNFKNVSEYVRSLVEKDLQEKQHGV